MNQTITVEKNVPIPAIARTGVGGGRPSRYGFHHLLAPGDSLFIPATTVKPKDAQQAAVAFARRRDLVFVTRTVREPELGMRVWRV